MRVKGHNAYGIILYKIKNRCCINGKVFIVQENGLT